MAAPNAPVSIHILRARALTDLASNPFPLTGPEVARKGGNLLSLLLEPDPDRLTLLLESLDVDDHLKDTRGQLASHLGNGPALPPPVKNNVSLYGAWVRRLVDKRKKVAEARFQAEDAKEQGGELLLPPSKEPKRALIVVTSTTTEFLPGRLATIECRLLRDEDLSCTPTFNVTTNEDRASNRMWLLAPRIWVLWLLRKPTMDLVAFFKNWADVWVITYGLLANSSFIQKRRTQARILFQGVMLVLREHLADPISLAAQMAGCIATMSTEIWALFRFHGPSPSEKRHMVHPTESISFEHATFPKSWPEPALQKHVQEVAREEDVRHAKRQREAERE